MIYLAALIFRWVAQALLPTLALLIAGAAVVWTFWWYRLRPQLRSSLREWLVLGAVVLAFGGWRTRAVWLDFARPELHMFRECIAKPIPREVQELAPGMAAPMPFQDAAYISFKAPREVVDRIIHHSLPGSTAVGLVEKMKRRSQRSTHDDVVIAGPDGRSYLKVDVDWAPKESSPEIDWARTDTGQFLRSCQGEAYVLLRAGAWGTFVSV